MQIEAVKYVESYRDYPDFTNDKNNYTLIPAAHTYYIADGENMFEIHCELASIEGLSKTDKESLLKAICIVPESENNLMQNITQIDVQKNSNLLDKA